MTRNTSEYLPAVLNVVTGAGVLLVSFLVESRLPISKLTAKSLGLSIVFAGMSLVVSAAGHLKGAFLGEVEPRLDVLVKQGPYRFVRHPVYLGMTIALFGAAFTIRSWPGLIGTLLIFLPSEIHRAKLEEAALARKFGDEWERYSSQTGFFLPSLKSLRPR